MISKHVAIENLKKYVGSNLYDLAIQYGITVFKDGKVNKGWKGLVLEIMAGLENNISKSPNGLGFELKSVAYHITKKGVLTPKETMAITMINPHELVADSFFNSHCWEKLKSLVFCACLWKERFEKDSTLISISSFDFIDEDCVIKEIEQDYELIRDKLITSGFSSLTGKDGKWIQARTKGPGHGSTSRAFYARKNLVELIVNHGIKHS